MLETRERRIREHRLEIDLPDANGRERHAADARVRPERGIHRFQTEHIFDVPQLEPARMYLMKSRRVAPARASSVIRLSPDAMLSPRQQCEQDAEVALTLVPIDVRSSERVVRNSDATVEVRFAHLLRR